MPPARIWRIAAALLVLAASGASMTATATARPAARHARAPLFAPYVDTSLSGEYSEVYHAITSQHLHAVTAGFVVARGHSCVPEWGGGTDVSNDPGISGFVKAARADGAAVIVSFGGQTGNEVATTCSSIKRLTAAYRSVVADLHVTHLDFDIEGAALGKPASITRRFAAIHALEARDHKLVVSLTVPVTPTGLDTLGLALLRKAKRAHARIELLNLMTMDYGQGRHEMGKTAIAVAKDALRQLRRYSPAATYRNIGITPMIGHNDTYSEVFTIADAHRIARFADSHHLGRLAFWSLDRDQKCTTRQGAATFDCSGISQTRLAFTHIFAS
jgi:chitinase